MEQNQPNTGVFINGRAQVVEMLQMMTSSEKDTLISNIRLRNPTLANELVEQSLTFEDLGRLTDHNLQRLIQYIKAPVLGVALKGCDENFQRKLLLLAPRDYAEEAYNIMVTFLQNEKRDTPRARRKIIETLISLKKRKLIQISQ